MNYIGQFPILVDGYYSYKTAILKKYRPIELLPKSGKNI